MKYLNDTIDIGTRLDKFTIIVDDEDYDRLKQFKWYDNGNVIHRYEYYYPNKKRYISLAEEVMRRHFVKFDHIDRNRCNNQKSNLREATFTQNACNKAKQEGGTSKYKGVSWETKSKKWFCKIQFQRKQIYIGRFNTQEEAALAYNEKAKEIHKEFAVLNIL
jgi:AP2 domain